MSIFSPSAALFTLACSALMSCAPTASPPAAAPTPSAPTPSAPTSPPPTYDDAALELFRERGVGGSFVLLDASRGALTIVGRQDADRPWLPCSTFKIPNTLIGLETGVIPGEEFALKWDGVEREYEAWNRDHDLRSALQNSVVWFYQEVARRIGQERMEGWVRRLDYGNGVVRGGIDHFWLDEAGELRISPRQQVEFLRRLDAGELPVSREHALLVKDLLPSEAIGDARLSYKTGLGHSEGRTVGWIVGYVTRAGHTYVFATHVDAPPGDLDRVMPLRKELTVALLGRLGVMTP